MSLKIDDKKTAARRLKEQVTTGQKGDSEAEFKNNLDLAINQQKIAELDKVRFGHTAPLGQSVDENTNKLLLKEQAQRESANWERQFGTTEMRTKALEEEIKGHQDRMAAGFSGVSTHQAALNQLYGDNKVGNTPQARREFWAKQSGLKLDPEQDNKANANAKASAKSIEGGFGFSAPFPVLAEPKPRVAAVDQAEAPKAPPRKGIVGRAADSVAAGAKAVTKTISDAPDNLTQLLSGLPDKARVAKIKQKATKFNRDYYNTFGQ